MSYRELAAQQHGFLLRSQLTEEEIQDAHQTGFIIDDYPLQSEYVFPTQLSSTATNYGYYWLWLLAFPTVPPEQRNPMPYFAGGAALDVQQIGWGSRESPVFIVMPEAYSAAGEIGFSWWLVEHYSAYHIDCPDGCVSGEPARGG